MRKERDWNQTQAFEALHVGLHLGPKSRASYIAVDTGARPPKVHEAEYLVRYFGQSPDDLPEPPETTEAADKLVVALLGQTEAISGLVQELRLARIRREESVTNGNRRLSDRG